MNWLSLLAQADQTAASAVDKATASTAAPEQNVIAAATSKVSALTEAAGQALDVGKGYALAFAPKVLGALIVIFIAWFVAGRAQRLLANLMRRAHIDVTLIGFMSNAARYIILVLGVLACLSTFGLEVTSFIALLSAISLAIGLAFQGSLSHLAAGIMLLIFRPFKVGDVVTVAGQTGKVEEIELFSTSLDSPDRRRITIPNGAIFGTTITNFTHHDSRVVIVRVGAALATEPSRVRSVLLDAADGVVKNVVGAVDDPPPKAQLAEVQGATQFWNVSVASDHASFDAVTEALTIAASRAIGAAEIGPPPSVSLVRNVP